MRFPEYDDYLLDGRNYIDDEAWAELVEAGMIHQGPLPPLDASGVDGGDQGKDDLPFLCF